MKVAIYTLTRDRLEYTKHCFETLRRKAGYPFDHFVVDNGSEDGTSEWLAKNAKDFESVTWFNQNKGISEGSNQALRMISFKEKIYEKNYDLIIKMDNDCEIVTNDILKKIVRIYEIVQSFENLPKYILSPQVRGINTQPVRVKSETILGHIIGMTAIVGGLFHIVPREVYNQYTYPLNMPKARGQDDDFCAWVRQQGNEVGYIEDLIVNHYETTNGQVQRFPAYFKRKRKEEKL